MLRGRMDVDHMKHNTRDTVMTRRTFLVGASSATALATAGCATAPGTDGFSLASLALDDVRSPEQYAQLYGPMPHEKFPIPAVNLDRVNPRFLRREVGYRTSHPVGTVIVDTSDYYLYLVEPEGRARRYGVGLGRAGFEWSGRGTIQWKRRWPTWTPPAEMIAREPRLKPYSAANGGMEPGLRNPLGARALYIFQDGRDTLYRLHGTRNARSIGRAVSSGCVRLLNQDVIDLYNRVKPGARIVVV